MIKHTQPGKRIINQALIRLLVSESSNPKPLQSVLLLIQFILFLFFISSKIQQPSILTSLIQHQVFIVISIVMILCRMMFRLTLVRVIYLPCVFILCVQETWIIYKIVISITLFINISAQITSRIQFQFVSNNPYSQSLNIAKPLHYVIIIASTYLRIKCQNIFPSNIVWIADLISMLLFILIFVVKLYSYAIDKFIKSIFLRFYLLVVVCYIRNIAANWNQQFNTFYMHLLVFAVSQAFYIILTIYQKRKQMKFSMSDQNVVGLVFTLLSYHFSGEYDENLQNIENQLLFSYNHSIFDNNHTHQQTVNQMKLPSVRKNMSNISSQNYKMVQLNSNRSWINTKRSNIPQKIKKQKLNIIQQLRVNKQLSKRISQKCLQLLREAYEEKTDNLYDCKFLIVQVKFYLESNFLVAKKFIDDLSANCSKIQLIKLICLYKLKNKITQQIIETGLIKCQDNYKQFFSNENLRNQIIKNSLDYLQLWQYILDPDFLFERLTRLVKKVLSRKKSIQQIYQNITLKCHNSIILYANYLFMVRRDVQKSQQLVRTLQIFKQSQTQLNISNKIYISIILQKQNQLGFDNVGYNIKNLLGYNRSQVKKSKVSLLIPNFFGAHHQELMVEALNSNNQVLAMYNRYSYVRHSNGYYLPAIINLHISYNKKGSLISEGYIEIKQDRRYNWTNCFILKQSDQQLIQIGPTLQEYIHLSLNKFHQVTDYFETSRPITNILSSHMVQVDKDPPNMQKYYYVGDVYYQFQAVKRYSMDDVYYYLYAAFNRSDESQLDQSIDGNKQSIQSNTNKYLKLKYQKFALTYQDHPTNLPQYFALKTQTITKINKKTPLMLFIIVIVLFVVCGGLIGFLLERVEVVNKSSLSIMGDLDDLVEFYHNLQNFGINFQKVLLINYKNKVFYYEYYKHQDICLALEEKNTLLAKFDKKIYGFSRQQANFQPKPLNILVSDMVANCLTAQYFSDPQIMSILFKNLKVLYAYIWSSTLDDYLKVCLQSAGKVTDIDNVYKLALGIFIGFAIIIIYILMIKINNLEREYEFYTLDLFSFVDSSFLFMNSINQFLRITINDIPESDIQTQKKDIKRHNRRNSAFGCNTSRLQLVSAISGREIGIKQISGKQSSARGLFEQSMLIKSANKNIMMAKNVSLPQNTLQLQQKIQQNEQQRKQKKTSPQSKLYIFSWTFVSLLTLSVLISNIIVNQAQSKIGIQKSLKSLLVLLNKQLVFSSTVICYLNQVGTGNSYSMFLANYQQFQNLQKETASFNELTLPQFSNFATIYRNFSFVYICDYIDCSDKNKKQFNISYGSAVQKFNNFMINNLNITVNDTKFDQDIQLLFDAHYILQNTFYKVLKTYLSDYKIFQNTKLTILLILYLCQFAVFILFFCATVVQYCCYFVKSRQECLEILDMIKEQSYKNQIHQTQ